MKKIIAIIISMLLLMTTSVFADGNIPEVLLKSPENFTAVGSISMSIDDNSDIRRLLEELKNTENAESGILGTEFLNFLSAMFEFNGTVNLYADISPDYKKIKSSLTNSNVVSSVVSSNLNYTVTAKCGFWADIDLTNEESPKMDLIFLSPTSDKYCYINMGEYITQESLTSFNTIFDMNELQKMQDEFSQLLFSNSIVEKTTTGYKITLYNDHFTKYMDAINAYSPTYETDIDAEMPATFKNMQFLGNDGITAVYTLRKGRISQTEVKADISVNISSIVKALGGEWPYEASGTINVRLCEKVNYTKIGTTEVQFPELNEDNSISLNDIMEKSMQPDDYYDDYTFEYPYSYVAADSNTLPVINGDYYAPLRSILEDGYGDSVYIDYQEGVITASSEYFPGFKTIRMTIGDHKVYVDESEQDLGIIMLIDGVTYVNTRLFTDVFGWELSDMTHDILGSSFHIGFWTYD